MKVVIGLFDIHYPYHINLDGVYKFIEQNKPDEIILGGDMIDCEGMSKKFYRGSPEEGLAKTFQEIKGFKNILNKLKTISPKSKFVYLIGNHEDRIRERIEQYPSISELIDLKTAYEGLIDEWKELNIFYKVGPLYYIHGKYHGMNFAKKHAMMYQKNVRFGHLHSIEEYSMSTPIEEKAISSKSIPCLCDLNPKYMKNGSSGRSNGFNIAYIDGDNYNDYNIVINDGHFIYNGITY